MPLTRRVLIRRALVAPLGFLLGRAMAEADQVIAGATAALRPTASGGSASRCAQCGASGHTMLDPTCPAARKVS